MSNEGKDLINKLKQLFTSSEDESDDNIPVYPKRPYDINSVLDQIQCIYTAKELEDILSGTKNTEPNELSKTNEIQFTSENFITTNEDHISSCSCDVQHTEKYWGRPVGTIAENKFDNGLQPLKVQTNKNRPLEFFQNLFPLELQERIVINTNLYAKQQNSKNYKDITSKELCAFLGMTIMMGLCPLSNIELYWSTDDFYKHKEISQIMTCKRYKKILENLHVCNNDDAIPRHLPGHDKLFKVREMMNILNHTFTENASQSQRQSIDESMIKFKGRSTLKQYMPAKPIKRGYKVWARCDAKTGYLYEFNIYTGRDNTDCTSINDAGLGYKVVTSLCKNVPANTLIAIDRFFSSLPLLETLHSKGIYCVGTFIANRKGIPLSIKETPRKAEKLAPGEFMYEYSHPTSVIRWHDKKDVLVMSNAFDPRRVEIIKRTQKDGSKKEIYCPQAICEYTKTMGGVDLFDHLKSSYTLGRRSRKNWLRIFWYLFEAAVINSYILYKQSKMDCAHSDFRLMLSRALINGFCSRKRKATIFKNKNGGNFGVPSEIRLANVGLHMPIPSTSKRCKYCSTKAVPKRSSYTCKICKVPICIYPCFENFHQGVQKGMFFGTKESVLAGYNLFNFKNIIFDNVLFLCFYNMSSRYLLHENK